MATHLTASDLAAFLRSRKSADCRIAADWVEDNPDSADVAWCLDRLEERARAAGLEIRQVAIYGQPIASLGFTYWDWCVAGLGTGTEQSILPVLALLTADYWKFLPASMVAFRDRKNSWSLICNATRIYCAPHLSSWAAACVRRLKRAHSSSHPGTSSRHSG